MTLREFPIPIDSLIIPTTNLIFLLELKLKFEKELIEIDKALNLVAFWDLIEGTTERSVKLLYGLNLSDNGKLYFSD